MILISQIDFFFLFLLITVSSPRALIIDVAELA
jgi:hypothetical protein